MRRLVYDQIQAEAEAQAVRIRLRAGLGIPKDQFHDDAQWAAQMRADQARLERLLASGELVIHSPRRFTWNPVVSR